MIDSSEQPKIYEIHRGVCKKTKPFCACFYYVLPPPAQHPTPHPPEAE